MAHNKAACPHTALCLRSERAVPCAKLLASGGLDLARQRTAAMSAVRPLLLEDEPTECPRIENDARDPKLTFHGVITNSDSFAGT
jgi:hypothetical protein